jgi:hypothetical protein
MKRDRNVLLSFSLSFGQFNGYRRLLWLEETREAHL